MSAADDALYRKLVGEKPPEGQAPAPTSGLGFTPNVPRAYVAGRGVVDGSLLPPPPSLSPLSGGSGADGQVKVIPLALINQALVDNARLTLVDGRVHLLAYRVCGGQATVTVHGHLIRALHWEDRTDHHDRMCRLLVVRHDNPSVAGHGPNVAGHGAAQLPKDPDTASQEAADQAAWAAVLAKLPAPARPAPPPVEPPPPPAPSRLRDLFAKALADPARADPAEGVRGLDLDDPDDD